MMASPEIQIRPGNTSQHGSLFGEYLIILSIGHAAVCAALCLVDLPQHPASVVPLVGALWVVAMGLQLWTNRPLNTALSLLLLLGCVGVQAVATVGLPLVFSPLAVALLLSVVLQREAWEWCYRLSAAEWQSRLKAGALQHGQRILFIIFLLLVCALPIVRTIIDEVAQSAAARQSFARMSFAQNLMFRLCESLSAFFFFVIGACVGSFLNVVIYRVPLGISTLITPSHCPGCSEKIHGKDNSPLLGWLKLAGKCRNCQTDISARYPVIELVVGFIFLLLYFVQLISGGLNLAGRTTPTYAGVLWILFYTKWPLVWLYVYHCSLFCTLLSWAMMRYDGHKVPRFSVGLMLVLFAAVPVFVPAVQPYPAGIDGRTVAILEMPGVISLLGIVAATGVCGLFHLLRKSTPPTDVASWLLLGIALGWQAVIGIGVLLLLLSFLYDSLIRRRDQAATVPHQAWLALPAMALMHHCFWKLITGLPLL